MSVAITGIGAVSALGENAQALWESIEGGRLGFSTISRFDVNAFKTQIGAIVPYGKACTDEHALLIDYGYRAAEEALQDARISDRSRVALMLGTSNGLEGKDIHTWSVEIAHKLQLTGSILTFATACTSSSHAIGFAADCIRSGEFDIVLAGGVDALCRDIFAGFYSLGILAEEPCAPFSNRMGATLGEGAAFMVLESPQSATDRKIQPRAYLTGYGYTADAFHDTSPEPSGRGLARAIESALENGQLAPQEIDYYNAHGTGTSANDASEWRAIERVFGDASTTLPVSSSKSFLGHAQGAAGSIEAIVTLMAIEQQKVPPTRNLIKPRPFAPTDPVNASTPRPHTITNALSASAAFGGSNSVLVLSKSSKNLKEKDGIHPSIGISGLSVTSDWEQLMAHVPRSSLRTLDTSARLLSNAVLGTLLNAGLSTRSKANNQVGLIVGQNKVSPESTRAFEDSIEKRGRTHLSAQSFTRMVVNAATGTCCRLFGLQGPTTTLSSGFDSGLVALVLAANHLAFRSDSETLIAASVDEPAASDTFEGVAASVMLHRNNESAPIRLAGWALAHSRDEAVQCVLEKTGYSMSTVSEMTVPGAPASASLQAVASACQAIIKGEKGPFLICNGPNGTTGVAIILERGICS